MNFSIILNSRGRSGLLLSLLDSIYSKSREPSKVEVLVKFDDDDHDSLRIIPLIESMFDNVKTFVSSRPTNLHVTINELAKSATGDFLFVINDDVDFVTEYWDSIILSKAEQELSKNKDNILYIAVGDTSIDKACDGKYASFPIITRESYEALGTLMPEVFVGLGGDVFVYRVFNEVDRVLPVNEVVLDHLLHRTLEQINNPDPTNFDMRQNTYAHLYMGSPWEVDISKEVNLLNEKITSSL